MASIGNSQDLGIKLTAIDDATDAASAITQLNLVIAALEQCGILTPN